MVRVTKEDYVRFKALEEAADEFAKMDYREARSELARWKTTFKMLADGSLYRELRDTIATINSGKKHYLVKEYDLPDNDPDPEPDLGPDPLTHPSMADTGDDDNDIPETEKEEQPSETQ